jgi:hypothetical protein
MLPMADNTSTKWLQGRLLPCCSAMPLIQTKGLLMSTAPQYSSLHCITGGRGNAVASVAAAVAAAANGTGSAGKRAVKLYL